MKFPYGVRDFYALRTEGYLYLDRTDRIPLIEEAGKELTFQHLDGEQLLLNALNEDAPLTISEVGERFGIREMLATGKRRDRMASLLCYLGALTLAGRTPQGKVILRIPNLVMRQLYIERLFEMALPTSRDQDAGRDAYACAPMPLSPLALSAWFGKK